MKTIDFESITLRKQISHRGGGIEIDLTTLGYESERMVAYQNYLGGGMLGKVDAHDSIRAREKFVELSLATELDEIAEQLKQYYFSLIKQYYFRLTNPEDEEWESLTYEQNQKMPISGY